MVDLYDFMLEIYRIYKQCKTEESMNNAALIMIECIKMQKELFRAYLEMETL